MEQNNNNQNDNPQIQVVRINSRQAILVALISSITAIITAFITLEQNNSPPKNTENNKFAKLEQLLSEQDFRSANQETANLMPYPYQPLRQSSSSTLIESSESYYLPCNELIKISQLWEKHSQGKFGFGVQRQIWLDVGGQIGSYNNTIYELFAEKVGWKSDKTWLSYRDFTFKTGASYGHLPTDLTATTKTDRIYSVIYNAKCPL